MLLVGFADSIGDIIKSALDLALVASVPELDSPATVVGSDKTSERKQVIQQSSPPFGSCTWWVLRRLTAPILLTDHPVHRLDGIVLPASPGQLQLCHVRELERRALTTAYPPHGASKCGLPVEHHYRDQHNDRGSESQCQEQQGSAVHAYRPK